MEARRKCGIKLACDLPFATSWNALQERATTGHVCGAGLPWDHQHLSNVHERSLSLQMCSLLGSFWCIVHRAQALANFLIRAVRPEAVEQFAMNHDRDLL